MTKNKWTQRDRGYIALLKISSLIVIIAAIYDLFQLRSYFGTLDILKIIGYSIVTAVLWAILWFAVFYAFMAGSIYKDSHRVFGNISSEKRKQMFNLASLSRMGRTASSGIVLNICLGMIGIILYGVLSNFRYLFLLFLAISVGIWQYLRTTRPPVLVYLSSSDPQSIFRHWHYKQFASPLRVITLLDVDSGIGERQAKELHLDCLRTTNDDDWWEVIKILLYMSPLIIIDTNAITSGVLREADHILSLPLTYKCIFLTSKQGTNDLLNEIRNSHNLDNLCIKNEEETLRLLAICLSNNIFPTREKPLTGWMTL